MTLYSTPAGAIDFWLMVAVAVVGLVVGTASTRLMACVMVASYSMNRVSVVVHPDGLAVACQGLAEACLMLIVLAWGNGNLSRGFAGLFLVDLVIYGAFLNGLLDFEWMKTASLVTFYFQMLLILAGAVNGAMVSHRGNVGRDFDHRHNGHGTFRLSSKGRSRGFDLRRHHHVGAIEKID